MNSEDLTRYKRQIQMEDITVEGQKKLKNSRALVIGSGGLGSPSLYYLAAAGIGTIGIVDSDVVDLSNLNRQILHFTKDIGVAKVDSAANKLSQFNPHININRYRNRLTESNVDQIVKDYDIVIDCVDNLNTRHVVNAACHRNKIPLVEAGVMEFNGFIMTIIPGHGACYRCLNPIGDNPEISTPPGIIGGTAGVAGSLQTIEAIKVLLNIGSPLVSKFLTFDTLNMSFDVIEIDKNPQCPVCSK